MKNPGRLVQWLQKRNIPQREAARVVGVSPPAFHAWVHGKKLPTHWHRVILDRWTGGDVPANGWATAEELELERRAMRTQPFSGASG